MNYRVLLVVSSLVTLTVLARSKSEHGEAFGTQIPEFKNKLTQDAIWKIITLMRGGFPVGQQQ